MPSAKMNVSTPFSTERNVIGNLVGSYKDLVELMALAAGGRVEMLTQTHPLDALNDAMDDLDAGRIRGRGTDPELATQRRLPALPVNGQLSTPPGYIADYLAAEQQLGRIRPDVSCNDAAVVLLSTLFGLSIMPTGNGGPDQHLLDSAVRTFLTGVAPPA